jgi:outer membrane receptor protein involved in Fe transport
MKKVFIVCCLLTAKLLHAQTTDTLTSKNMEEVVVAASRVQESILRSPVSVQKLTSREIKLSPSPSFFDALENIQGVQMITPSMGFKVLNARGFANTTNVRFAQLADGMDVQSPHIGGPIGSALGPGDLDVDNVEILPGTASALYGMNTVNGLANITSKDPFATPGIAVLQKTAVTHVSDANSPAKIFSETSFRIAHIVSPKFAFKLNGTFIRGTDWIANDQTDLNPAANSSLNITGANNPASDPVNSYGNESSDRKTIPLGGKNYVVSRTGYNEKDVVDYGLQTIKGDAGLYYKISSNATISYLYHFALVNNVYQRANRFRLQNYLLQQHGLQYKSKSIEARLYLNSENTGQSYNLRSMAENIDRSFKPDNAWYADYTTGFNQTVQAGATAADALRQARAFADHGRFLPGTKAFDERLKKLQDINNWDSGAALQVKAAFVQAEVQVNLTEAFLSSLKKNNGIEILTGFDSRKYIIEPDGNYFINPVASKAYSNIQYSKTGGFISVTKNLLNNKLKLGGIVRADKNDYFSLKWNLRFTAVFSPAYEHNFRLSFQKGYRFPAIFEAYSNVNSGGVKRVGGLPVMSDGIFENAWLQTSVTAFQQAVLKDINRNSLTQNQAISKNQSLLKKNSYTYINPEHIQSVEAGYKGLFANRRLYLNADLYFNRYNNFIAQANMNVPKTQYADSIPFALYDKSSQSQYRMWTNSQSIIYNYGFSAGVTYHFKKDLTAAANTSFSKLKNTENEDGLEDGFNTPQWILNLSLSKQNIVKQVDAGVVYKWQSAYYWQSFLAVGNVAAYGTLDAQLTWTIKKIHSNVKLGASNLLNHYYASFLGGPAVGGMYYVTIVYGLN